MSDLNERLNDLGTRLERIEGKLDDHLQRVTKAESDIGWLRGHARISIAIFLAVIGALGTVLLNMIFPNK